MALEVYPRITQIVRENSKKLDLLTIMNSKRIYMGITTVPEITLEFSMVDSKTSILSIEMTV